MVDFSAFSAEQRRIAHQAGRGDGNAERDAAWIQQIAGVVSAETITAVDGDDITQQLLNAVAALNSAGRGVIVLPPCRVYLTQPLHIGTSASEGPFAIVGRGFCEIYYTPDNNGPYATTPALRFGTTNSSAVRHIHLENFRIQSNAAGSDTNLNHGGLLLSAVTHVGMHKVEVIGFGGGNLAMSNGYGLQITDGLTGVGDPCQEIDVSDCMFTSSTRNVVLDGVINCSFRGVQTEGAVDAELDLLCVRHFLWDAKLMEGNSPFGVRGVPRTGGFVKQCTFRQVYNEGVSDRSVFYFDGSASAGSVQGLVFESCTPRTTDSASSERWHLNNVWGVRFAGNQCEDSASVVSLYARNCKMLYAEPGDCVFGGVLDLDATSMAALTAGGDVLSQDGRSRLSLGTGAPAAAGLSIDIGALAGAVRLPSYALGQEPASAPTGAVARSSTTGRVIVKQSSGAWEHLAYATDPEIPLGSTMIEYFDLRTSSLVTQGGGSITQLVGHVTGLVLTAPSGHEPVYHATDADFGGKPSIEFDPTGSGDCLRNTAVPNTLVPAGTQLTVVVVGKFGYASSIGNAVELDAGALAVFGLQCGTISAVEKLVSYQFKVDGTIDNGDSATAPNTAQVVVSRQQGADGSTHRIRQDGTDSTGTTGVVTKNAATKLSFGDDPGLTTPAKFKMVAAYILSSDPGDAVLERFETLAAAEWSL